jgi:glycosyltransferase involved in cell wall biosynthesis
MKILILTTLYRPHLHGGSEKAATLLAEALAASGHQVSVITLQPGHFLNIQEMNGVRIYRLPLANRYWPFGREHPASSFNKLIWHLRDIWNSRATRRVGRILDLEEPNIVHTHSIAGFSVSVLKEIKRRNIRLVHTQHDYYLMCLKSSMFRNGHTCKSRCFSCTLATLPRRYASTLIDAVIPVSQYLLDRHHSSGYLTNTPTRIIPNINTPVLVEDQPSHSIQGPLTFGYIGRIEPHKGVEVLLKACVKIQHPQWRLRIAGHAVAGYLRHLQQTYLDPRIEWLGFTDPASFFHSIDICIVPSLWAEPQPYVVLEALEAGKTVIASDSGGLPEMAAFGKHFTTFSSGDSDALAHALNEALLNPEMWRDGGFLSEEIRQRFQPMNIVAEHLAVYINQSNAELVQIRQTPNQEAATRLQIS